MSSASAATGVAWGSAASAAPWSSAGGSSSVPRALALAAALGMRAFGGLLSSGPWALDALALAA
eukprot:16427500-Heterocapsa_arctica.AAC.1